MSNRDDAELQPLLAGDAAKLAQEFDEWGGGFGRIALPDECQTAAVALRSPKIAALFYDRVWAPRNDDTPSEVRLWGDTPLERMLAIVLRPVPGPLSPHMVQNFIAVIEHMDAWLGHTKGADRVALRGVARAIGAVHKTDVVPVYESAKQRTREYREGDLSAIVVALSNLPIVSGEDLTWEQVLALRHDSTARNDLRRLIHWLDATMVGKSQHFIEDEIAVRLERYQTTMRHHGIKTVVGSLSAVLDSRFLVGGAAVISAAAYANNPTTAALVGSAIVVGKIAVHVAQLMLDLDQARNGENAEVAFVAELAANR